MLISHEVPIKLMDQSKSFNDYDYALVHLFNEHPEYYDFFLQSLDEGRCVILDNSLFELNEQFDSDEFAGWVEKLKPTEYIIPDKFDDTYSTINAATDWHSNYKSLPGKSIGVVQGSTISEMVYCYRKLAPIVDKIAFSFASKSYLLLDHDENKLLRLARGRVKLLNYMYQNNVIDTTKPHHLLGVAVPQEGLFYTNKFNWIESIDTSNPVMSAIEHFQYEDEGRTTKSDVKMADIIADDVSLDDNILQHNLNKFREFWW